MQIKQTKEKEAGWLSIKLALITAFGVVVIGGVAQADCTYQDVPSRHAPQKAKHMAEGAVDHVQQKIVVVEKQILYIMVVISARQIIQNMLIVILFRALVVVWRIVDTRRETKIALASVRRAMHQRVGGLLGQSCGVILLMATVVMSMNSLNKNGGVCRRK